MNFTPLYTKYQNGFKVVIDTTDEYLDIHDYYDYDDAVRYNKLLQAKEINWFIARARVFVESFEIQSIFIGKLLYVDINDFVKDGSVDALIDAAIEKSKQKLPSIINLFSELI